MSKQLYPIESFFWQHEFVCPCLCGFGSKPEHVNPKLITLLNIIRLLYGQVMIVTSGARCPDYNLLKGGVENSAHTPGQSGQCDAADIRVFSDVNREKIVKIAQAIGIARIGVAGRFVHFDVSEELPSPRLWTY